MTSWYLNKFFKQDFNAFSINTFFYTFHSSAFAVVQRQRKLPHSEQAFAQTRVPKVFINEIFYFI